MEPLFSELWWKVKIEWQEAEAYEQVKNGSSYDFDEKAFLYMITGRFSNRAPKLFYIGKTYFQVVSWRLGQLPGFEIALRVGRVWWGGSG
jgi:hypothetical protein